KYAKRGCSIFKFNYATKPTEAVISKTLERMKVKSPSNYDKALSRIREGELHPLYQNRASLQQYFGD
ncbi:hypothetical protein AB6E16_22665, partial [Vibrio atlanticus]|uniref:hypothetical protein n=1 Tax=Vibrio atlanticus TaxID=693153 RepID=UPI00354FE329